MIKLAKVINETTGQCVIGIDGYEEQYIAQGFTEQDVEQSDVDNNWYLTPKCPHKTEEQKKEELKTDFYNKFLATSLGNYRLQPKGYSNAQQSIDTVNNMVEKLGSLTEEIATMVLFYETPDFTKEEECTEEWLVQHQYSASPMTKAEWNTYYVEFTTKYAQKRYQQQILGVL